MIRDPAVPETVDERLLDLLVDGELDGARCRELVAQLDATSGGWRQCSLAFLEAQAWRRDLRNTEHVSRNGNLDAGRADPARPSPVHRLLNWGVLAMSIGCAFVAGWIARPAPDRHVTAGAVAPVPRTADQKPATGAGPTAINTTASGHGERGPGEAAPDEEKDNAGVRIAGVVTLKFDDHGQEREMQLPVIDGAGIDLRQWLDQPSAVKASAVQALERRGHKVESQRQLLTVNLKDGRKLLLPVDQVDVRFAHRVYQ